MLQTVKNNNKIDESFARNNYCIALYYSIINIVT